MKITKDPLDDEVRYAIRGYGPGEIRVNETVHTSNIILTRNRLRSGWNPPPITEWEPPVLDELLEFDPEIVLIGTGARVQLLGTAFLAHALKSGTGLETMDTAAACRTFNILVAEGRRVAAGLIVK